MLTVIIPARNEIYLQRTIQNVLDNAEGEIEIIAVLDGYWPDPPIKDDKRVILIHHVEAIGQRQSINEAARVAKGEYIMKLDAHCAVDKGFDVKLAADCEYDWTVVPRMYNLDKDTWKPKLHKRTDYMFMAINDKGELRSEYYDKGLHQPDNPALIDDTMTCMGPGWFMHKDRFWELEGMDCNHTGWGQMGIELACKAWLSGGSMKVNKKTWFSHWFRGGGGPGFPYPLSGKDVAHARAYSKDLWLNDKWPKQTRKFAWLIEKFNPPGWNVPKSGTPDTTIVYLTDNTLDPILAAKCRKNIIEAADGKPIISVSQEPIDFGKNVCVGRIGRSWLSLIKQLIAGAEAATTKYVAIAEHDGLYTKDHFNFVPPRDDTFYYNKNHYLVEWSSGHPEYRGMYSKRWAAGNALSQLVCNREALLKSQRDILVAIKEGVQKAKSKEPGIMDKQYEFFETPNPNLDIRHDGNFTGPKRGIQRTYEIPFWGKFQDVMEATV